MAITHQQRLSMHAKLTDIMGPDDAETLVEHLPTVEWDQIATKDDVRASEFRILSELAKTKAALLKTNEALLKTNEALAETKVSFGDALAETRVSFGDALAKTNEALAETKVSFGDALADTKAALTELKGDVRLGFARLERRLAWYLVAVAALLVGFGLAVWIPLVGALAEIG